MGASQDNLIESVNLLETTTSLLMKYNPTFTCTLVGAKTALDSGYLDCDRWRERKVGDPRQRHPAGR